MTYVTKTFEYQDQLPRLPIPDLDYTCDSFLDWVEPLLTQAQFTKTKEIVKEFKSVDGDGAKLQRTLREYVEKNQLTNWVAPLWEDVYLKPRIPLIIEGNVFYLLKRKVNSNQAELATQVILSALEFKNLIDKEKLKIDMQNQKPICMEQYKRIFSSTRIPRKQRDELIKDSSGKHILILYKDNIYSINVIDHSGKIKPYGQIINALEDILSQDTKGQGMGIFTSMDRDQWAGTRDNLLSIDTINRKNIEKIENAIFAVCLDDTNPNSLEETSQNLLHGNGKNRWYDKSLQFIITKNGFVGINMEHTGVDGSPMSNLVKYIYNGIDVSRKVDKAVEIEKTENLNFTLNDDLGMTLKKAVKEFQKVAANHETRVMIFDEFGTNTIKTFQVSPDAFIQLAIHLAQYKLYGKCSSTYESVMTRKFLHGRIEVMYTVSKESLQFAKSMISESYSDAQRKAFLKEAAHRHIDRIHECQEGRGVDGHFMALLDIYHRFGKELGIDSIPEIFTDDGYKILTHSTICTSTTSPNGLLLAGYGPVVEDGFSLRYIKDKEEIRFNIVSRKYKEKEMETFMAYLKESLKEMAQLMGYNN